jgi:parallel beta-helix repeat protein
MKNKKLLYIISFFTLAILVSSPLLTVWFFENQIQNKNELVSKEQKLMNSESWILTNPILIDDSDPSKNWSKTANDNDWCSGSGTWNDPYVLKNIWMNISHPCIEVRSSKVYFGIWNCSLFTKGDPAIVLINVNNSNIYNNKISVFFSVCEGIFLSYSNNNSIDNNFIWDSYVGIRILNGSRNGITSNLIKDCFHHGIIIQGSNSHDCYIFNNTLINNMAGVYLFGRAHKLSNNIFKGCGIVIGYNREEVISYNIDTSNTLNNKPIYYYANKTNLSPLNFINAGQILLANCNNSKIADLNFSNTGLSILMVYCSSNEISNISIMNEIYGMALFECEDNKIKNNEIKHCGMGIWTLGNCNNNEFIENSIINTTAYGIRLAGDDNNVFSYNLFKDNQMYGLSLSEYSDGNLIYKNIFLNNSDHANDGSVSNYWDNGTVGNYWDDYEGLDLNGDGIGDSPYNISGPVLNQDNFPLMYPPSPEILIMKPSENTIFGSTPPEFEISLQGFNIVSIWYTIDNGAHNYTITKLTGTINQTAWNSLADGPVTIRFYIRDITDREVFEEVIVVKRTTIVPSTPPGIPSYDLIALIGVYCIITVILIKKKWDRIKE